VSAATASGPASTLSVQVNDVTWTELDTLLDAGAADRAYQVRTDDTGVSTVTFGDGVRGARLPTGRANVIATYRTGMGLAGEVATGALSLLAHRPLGVRAVTNPVDATGAADPEAIEDARANAPRTVRTLDRIVSLSDYEDFARGFAGVGKARGAAVWDGDGRLVHVTVAAVDGNTVDPTSALYTNLVAAIAALSDGIERYAVDSFVPRHFALEASILVDADRTPDDVLAAAIAAVTAAYAFAARELAQPVTEAEVMTLLAGVPGVTAAFVSKLYRTDRPATLEPVISAADAAWNASTRKVTAAELLLLLPTRLHLSVVTS
jgi:predicted phage baseplate assembly protein